MRTISLPSPYFSSLTSRISSSLRYIISLYRILIFPHIFPEDPISSFYQSPFPPPQLLYFYNPLLNISSNTLLFSLPSSQYHPISNVTIKSSGDFSPKLSLCYLLITITLNFLLIPQGLISHESLGHPPKGVLQGGSDSIQYAHLHHLCNSKVLIFIVA